MKIKQTIIPQVIVGLLILLGFTALYVDTRTGVHTFDALSYTQDVQNKPFRELYHPHHLLYAPAGRLAVDAAGVLGYGSDVDAPIQVLNAFAGALGIVLLWRFGVRLTGRIWQSLPMALVVGMCYAYWFYATEVEVYTLAAVFISWALWLLAEIHEQPRLWKVVLLGLATAGAIMFHQTNLMFVIPVVLFLLIDHRKYIIHYGVVAGLGTIIPYLLVAYNSHLRDWDSFYKWVTGYAQTGEWGGYLSLDHIQALWDGLRNTISLDESLALAFYGLALLGLVIGGRRLARSWWAFIIGWLVLYGGFFWWWEPWNIEFWIALLPLWSLMMLVGLSNTPASTEETSSPNVFREGVMLPLAALMLTGLLFLQHDDPIRKAADPQHDYYQQITLALQPHLMDSDVVISRGNVLDLYLDYYAKHPPSQVVSMRALRQAGFDALAVLRNRIEPAYQTGRLIYIDAILLDEPQSHERNPFGLSVETIAALQNEFPIQVGIDYNGVTVFYQIGERLPPDATAWQFEANLQGWLEFGSTHPRFENNGWCIDGSPDPWLESPPLSLNATDYHSLAIDLMLAEAQDTEGQLFWHGADSGFSEAASIRFPLEVGRHTYTLPLSDAGLWQGDITALRLDPFQDGVGSVCIYGLVLK